MDTKLKSNKKYINNRLWMLSLIIVILPLILVITYANSNKHDTSNSVKSNYVNEIYSTLNDLTMYAEDLKGTLREDSIISQVEEEKRLFKENIESTESNIEIRENKIKDDYNNNYYDKNIPLEQHINNDYELINLKKILDEAKKNLGKSDEQIRRMVVNNFRVQVDQDIQRLSNNVNVEYFFGNVNPDKAITNVNVESAEEFIEETKDKYKYYVMNWVDNEKNLRSDTSKTMMGVLRYNGNEYNEYAKLIRIKEPLVPGDTIYDVVSNKEFSDKVYKIGSIILAICFVLATALIISIYKNRKLDVKENVFIKLYSKLYLEFKMAVILLMAVSFYVILNEFRWIIDKNTDNDMFVIISILGAVIILVIASYLVLSDIYKLLKGINKKKVINEVVNKTVLYKFTKYILKFKNNLKGVLKDIWKVRSTAEKTIITVGLLFIYVMVIVGEIVAILLGLIQIVIILFIVSVILTIAIFKFILGLAQNINLIKDITGSIVQGNYNNKVDINGIGIIKDIADDLSNIETGLNKAVNKAVSSERTKGELITNVSHDLKTPLTSIINYVDLLSKDNVSEEDREKYISVLKEKSLRLKGLIEDLFEVSKASSGSMELNMENIDPVALLRQTIGEFEDKIEGSGLEFIKRLPEEKLFVYADGRKAFRVFQNLISNILKYSLKGSRVYIEVVDRKESVEITFKNISQHELNFNEEEILERFKRGDEARSTEGYGLGLAIAKSLVELQGGEFEIVIDGDLFKAIVMLKKKVDMN
ncbi:histidine kinase dimerization/phospho-acceptor domain-containing protein [Clostridium paraputrificum]|uniref:histidine kinase dimerization/phospho-acceptor domain-containing protein n=1 Tax=Clostridium paraputrificum TaxID=29363 RepID=UPI003D346325